MAGESEHKTKKRGPPLRVERDDVHIFATGAMYQGALDKEKSLGDLGWPLVLERIKRICARSRPPTRLKPFDSARMATRHERRTYEEG